MDYDNRASERLVQMSSDDDSDGDLVTDYLSSTNDAQDINSSNKSSKLMAQGSNASHNNNHHNMVPIISVTPHSPGTKYNNILEDTLNQLQSIRESVVKIKNAPNRSPQFISSNQISLSNSSRLFSSCPSLPDLTAANINNIWPNSQYSGLNSDRRKSWTAIEDLTECSKNSHKSVSLSSLDSEEQESLRAAERLHNRSSRNSTGGISTHSLNEAELARDFERINAKRNLAPQIPCRIPLQKSISTPSIAPIRNQNVKEESTIQTSRHLSDSEDDNQDDRSLLCVRDKNEVYADHPEKRRKRGSLFFRKKKDKSKTKGQSTNCDACGAVINLATYKEHAIECKAKIAKSQQSTKSSGKKNSTSSYSDDTPLIRNEFLNEPHITAQSLSDDPILGMANEDEHDSWSPKVGKDVLKSLNTKEVKRQEHIYELIITEKRHCQTLLLMQKVFAESLERHFSHVNLERLFPRLKDLTDIHTGFLKKLRRKQNEDIVVDSVADILLDFFSGSSAQRLKSVYGDLCANHPSAVSLFKSFQEDRSFVEWHKHKQTNPLLKRKGIPECTLFVVHRLTKYPILIEDQLKLTKDREKYKVEYDKLFKACTLIKEILLDVNSRVAEKQNEARHLAIYREIDVKSCTLYKQKKFSKSDVIQTGTRKLKFEGTATLMQGRSKMQTVNVVVLTDCLFFLQENSNSTQRAKYTFFTPENKAGVVPLQKLLIRDKAGTESRGIYIISSNPAYPEMYELKVINPKDRNSWIQSIRAAVLNCPSDENDSDEYLTAEQKQMILDAKHLSIRDLITAGSSEMQDKMRQKDFEQAIILEEKIALQARLLIESSGADTVMEPESIEAFLSSFGTYKELITDDCDTVEILKRVYLTIQEISQLASNLYKSATGFDLPVRSFSSIGERQSEAYQSPKLPTRAETFGGFDEKKGKANPPWRDAVISTINNTISIHKDNQEKRDSYSSETDTILSAQSNHTRLSQDLNYEALQVSHHLHTLLCIINQQMTTISSLQVQVNATRENPKTLYRHNDQLEELRNLQDKLQEEKTVWLKQKESQEKELDERRMKQEALQRQIRAEQEDIKQQREQLFRTMERLTSQGVILSPNVPIPTGITSDDILHAGSDDHHITTTDGTGTSDRRKDKYRSTMSKTPPANLLSATNAPKLNPASVKQQLPLKLSSLSSTKSEKTATSNSSNTLPSPVASSGGVIQMLPLKLADKKNHQNITPNHTRTGSSPAVIQQLNPTHTGNPAIRTNTYPKIPERFRLRSSDGSIQHQQQTLPHNSGQSQQRSISVYGTSTTSTVTKPLTPPANLNLPQAAPRSKDDKSNENQEEIYF
ncbi:rho guanine nucleotide exchange factor 28 isoform X4 [Bradysia coprophila]|uniref:rho guanine nucleotide exchange factor 28 isoform X4 n=1 Tax=Bradysia coprophila TaxID=38358 RepID=UPI00187D74EE|nr:rho guanine nucleotide exchange factor 28 isoform X4 [Bradysia coprophila]